MMWLWTSSLNFVLAILQLGFNLLVLIAVASDRRLHTNIHLLSTSLWVCNSITAIVTIFFSLNPSQCLEVPCFQHQQLPKQVIPLKNGVPPMGKFLKIAPIAKWPNIICRKLFKTFLKHLQSFCHFFRKL